MARFFNALVVLGGSLAGCGGRTNPPVGRTHDEDGSQKTTTEASFDTRANASTAVATGNSPGETVQSASTGDVRTDGGRGETDPAMQDTSATDGIVTLTPPPPTPKPLPEDCALEQLSCESIAGCHRDGAPTCGAAWSGEIESCPVDFNEFDCQCTDAGAPNTCPAGQLLTCLYGERATADGRTEPVHVACECLPTQDSCELMCEAHSSGVGSYQRACVTMPELTLCGGCIWAGILRLQN